MPSLVATIVVLPSATPVTRPVAASTEAIATLPELHVTERPVNTALFASRRDATALVVLPAVIVDAVRVTVTDATGTRVTVIVACPEIPSLVATIVVFPSATPVTAPVDGFTVAIVGSPELHVTTRPVSVVP